MTRALPTAFFLLAALPGAALAAPDGGPKADTAACNAEQMQVIDAAFDEAARRTRRALITLALLPHHTEFKRWFGETRPKVVARNFQIIAASLSRETRPTLTCNLAHPTCTDSTYAFAHPAGRLVNFCGKFFRSGSIGADSRFGVVVHEISHVVAGTRDAVYGSDNAAGLAKQAPIVAATNADNYEYLVEHLGE